MRRAWLALLAASAVGCVGTPSSVTRIVDGRTVQGRFVPPEAYASFLKGAIAEAHGALDEAVQAYEAVARMDDSDPEVFARLARVRCERDPHDARGREAIAKALELDGEYGPAWAAAAACEGGDAGALARAARAEPRDAGLQVAFARALEQRSSAHAAVARERLLALTLDQPESSEALAALASWADVHDDLNLFVLALSESAQRAPHLDPAVARAALALAGEGQLARARRVAAVLLDSRARPARGSPPLDEPTRAALGRLAVDEAAERGDEPAIRRRAVVGRLTPAAAAARAALVGRFDVAARLARETLGADPDDLGARMVLASATDATGAADAFAGARASARTVPASACGVFARALLRSGGPAAARAAMSAAACNPVAHDDSAVVSLYVDLAARGIVDASALPLEGRIELAWRTRVPFSGHALAGLDLRHELLARTQSDPLGARTAELAAKLARRVPSDPMVLASLLAVAHARGQTADQVARAALAPPADPVLDATLLTTLPKSAPERVRVRARFAALAATPAERALIR